MQNDIKMSLQTKDKLAGNENLPIVKTESKVGIVRQLPISERMIYHGRNWIPMTKFGEGEEEADCECSWVEYFTKKRLDDITDVNTAEKTLMNMWNVHISKYQGRGFQHLDKVLEDFLTEHSNTLIELNLYRNFVSHLASMQQAGLIGMDTMLYIANAMQEVMKVVMKENKLVVGQVWKEQMKRELEKKMKKVEAEKMSKIHTKSKASNRVRPSSNLPGSCVNVFRSPSRRSPLSPSRSIVALSRGRRFENETVNVQKTEVDFGNSEIRGDLFQDKTCQISVSSLLEWQVTATAGLREKEEKLEMTMGFADRQKSKIEELEKLKGSKEEIFTQREILLSMKKEMTIMGKQLKTVSTHIRQTANYVDSMEKRLEAILNLAKTSSDDETTPQEHDLAETRSHIETKEEVEGEALKLKLRAQ